MATIQPRIPSRLTSRAGRVTTSVRAYASLSTTMMPLSTRTATTASPVKKHTSSSPFVQVGRTTAISTMATNERYYQRPSLSSFTKTTTTTTTSGRNFNHKMFYFRAMSFSSSSSSSSPLSFNPAVDRLLVIGSGVAGSATALLAAERHGIPVTMLYAGKLQTDCNSNWAQGGIIYQNVDPAVGDSPASLAADIHRAGAGRCQDDAVQKVATEGPRWVEEFLLNQAAALHSNDHHNQDNNNNNNMGPFANVPFDRTPQGALSLCLEASHAAPRILHKADHTGRIITEHLAAAVARHARIRKQPHTVVTDLIWKEADDSSSSQQQQQQCIGVRVLDRMTGQFRTEYATFGVVLASGGLAGIYEHSTNPAGFNALGSSVALAARAGVVLQDLEFVQFHPTALYLPQQPRFLLSEALRGEGAILRDGHGYAFCADYHPNADLAPRDIVARAVFDQSQKKDRAGQHHNVFLDITHRDATWLHQRFPSIQAHLAQRGLDLARDQLPITPAAHYTCGGIATDLHGRTSMAGLYAAGEAARTGLHGGNRLASTSLLEGLVFGASVANYVGSDEGRSLQAAASNQLSSSWDAMDPSPVDRPWMDRATSQWEPLQMERASYRAFELLCMVRRIMWDHVGVLRTPRRLQYALATLHNIQDETNLLHALCTTLETAAARDAATAAWCVAQAALSNPHSVGAHCIVPDSDDDNDEIFDSISVAADKESDEDEAPLTADARQ